MYKVVTAKAFNEKIAFDAPSFEDFNYSDYRPGYLYVVTRALASRINANLDAWPIQELRTAYKTFLGRPAHVEHHNSEWKQAKGVIADVLYRETKLASGYKEGAIYLLIEVDAQTFPRLGKAILDGKIKGVSMGADIEYSSCTICGNKAENPHFYCRHMPFKGHVIEDMINGKKVRGLVAEKCHGINFFEISFVFDPADESAYILGKKYIPMTHSAHKIATSNKFASFSKNY